MTARPILFSGPMVRAILEGRKTETRRTMKPQPKHGVGRYTRDGVVGEVDWVLLDRDGDPADSQLRSPYGQPGDRLWVKERIDHIGGGVSVFAADFTQTKADAWPWKRSSLPSIHCPRGLSRITLEVVSVRVERLHDITEASALAEGVRCRTCGGPVDGSSENECECFHNLGSAIPSFASLWESINGEGSWGANPWVWVVQFQRVQP